MKAKPIVELATKIQKRYGENITSRIVDISGEPHCPIVTVEIELPNGDVYQASDMNKKLAKNKAAKEALLKQLL